MDPWFDRAFPADFESGSFLYSCLVRNGGGKTQVPVGIFFCIITLLHLVIPAVIGFVSGCFILDGAQVIFFVAALAGGQLISAAAVCGLKLWFTFFSLVHFGFLLAIRVTIVRGGKGMVTYTWAQFALITFYTLWVAYADGTDMVSKVLLSFYAVFAHVGIAVEAFHQIADNQGRSPLERAALFASTAEKKRLDLSKPDILLKPETDTEQATLEEGLKLLQKLLARAARLNSCTRRPFLTSAAASGLALLYMAPLIFRGWHEWVAPTTQAVGFSGAAWWVFYKARFWALASAIALLHVRYIAIPNFVEEGGPDWHASLTGPWAELCQELSLFLEQKVGEQANRWFPDRSGLLSQLAHRAIKLGLRFTSFATVLATVLGVPVKMLVLTAMWIPYGMVRLSCFIVGKCDSRLKPQLQKLGPTRLPNSYNVGWACAAGFRNLLRMQSQLMERERRKEFHDTLLAVLLSFSVAPFVEESRNNRVSEDVFKGRVDRVQRLGWILLRTRLLSRKERNAFVDSSRRIVPDPSSNPFAVYADLAAKIRDQLAPTLQAIGEELSPANDMYGLLGVAEGLLFVLLADDSDAQSVVVLDRRAAEDYFFAKVIFDKEWWQTPAPAVGGENV